MTSRRGARIVRAGAAARAGWGCVLLFAPGTLLGLAGRPVPAHAIAVARVLGARQVLQSAVTTLAPNRSVAGLSAAVDTLHAGTDLALAVVSPRWRRVALIDALVGTGLAASGWVPRLRPSLTSSAFPRGGS